MNRARSPSAEPGQGIEGPAAQPDPAPNPSSPIERSNPFIWVSWLSKLMAGEKQCEWASWFRAHYIWDKVPSGLDDVHAPAVASLNGVIANLAVTEFLAFATGFKPLQRYIHYDLLKARTVGLNFDRDPNCYTCSPTGSLAVGDVGAVLPADMLVR